MRGQRTAVEEVLEGICGCPRSRPARRPDRRAWRSRAAPAARSVFSAFSVVSPTFGRGLEALRRTSPSRSARLVGLVGIMGSGAFGCGPSVTGSTPRGASWLSMPTGTGDGGAGGVPAGAATRRGPGRSWTGDAPSGSRDRVGCRGVETCGASSASAVGCGRGTGGGRRRSPPPLPVRSRSGRGRARPGRDRPGDRSGRDRAGPSPVSRPRCRPPPPQSDSSRGPPSSALRPCRVATGRDRRSRSAPRRQAPEECRRDGSCAPACRLSSATRKAWSRKLSCSSAQISRSARPKSGEQPKDDVGAPGHLCDRLAVIAARFDERDALQDRMRRGDEKTFRVLHVCQFVVLGRFKPAVGIGGFGEKRIARDDFDDSGARSLRAGRGSPRIRLTSADCRSPRNPGGRRAPGRDKVFAERPPARAAHCRECPRARVRLRAARRYRLLSLRPRPFARA